MLSLRAAAGVALGLLAAPTVAVAAASLELYGTLESMGVIITIDAADDPDSDLSAAVESRTSGGGPYRPAFPPDRVAPTRLVGSLFRLAPGTGYDVRVVLADPDGGPIDGAVLTASATTRSEVVLPAPSRTLHASPGGSGTTCDPAAPCALAEALDQVQAGEEVVLLAGSYHVGGGLTPARSGAPGQPIVLRGESPGTAVLDGADPTTFAWTVLGGGVYQTAVNVAAPQVIADDQRLFPYQSLADLQSLSWSLPGFFASGTDLYVRLPGDADPNGAALEVSRENVAFVLAAGRDHIAFVDLAFRNYGQGSYPKAIYLNGGSENLIRGCSFRHNEIGVGIKRASGRNLIEDNAFTDSRFLWSWDAEKASGMSEEIAATFYAPLTGRGNVFRRNRIQGGFDGIATSPETAAAITNETDINDNLIFEMGDDGISADGYASNLRIWGNRFHDVLVAVSLAPAYVGPTYVFHNLVYQIDTGVGQWAGSPFKLNSGASGTSGPMYILHNTVDVVSPAQNSFQLVNPGTWTKLVVRNNILSATQRVIHNSNTSNPADFDYDCTWTTGSGFATWAGLGSFATLAEFQAASGQEPNAVYAPPDFSAPAGADYTLRATSGCIDRGVVLPGINDGYAGSGPDMGAFEFRAACAPVPPLGAIGNSVTARKGAGGAVELAWGATVNPPNHAVFRTGRPDQLDETPAGIGDETLLGVTAATALADPAPPPVPVCYYAVLPADNCGAPVFP